MYAVLIDATNDPEIVLFRNLADAYGFIDIIVNKLDWISGNEYRVLTPRDADDVLAQAREQNKSGASPKPPCGCRQQYTREGVATMETVYIARFSPVYGFTDDDYTQEYIAEVDATVEQGEPFENPPAMRYDDTIDLRNRWFPTLEEAQEHIDYICRQFTNPLPWESFVQI